MLEISNKTNLLEQASYKYSLQDIEEPNLYREMYNYDEVPKVAFNHRRVPMNMSALKPMIACPHSPDKVVTVESLKGTKVDQVCIGSCTNSSLYDMLKVAALLKGRTIKPSVSLSISPGSKQVLSMLPTRSARRAA
jgi:3-isopropylmalate dehydratase large subunit